MFQVTHNLVTGLSKAVALSVVRPEPAETIRPVSATDHSCQNGGLVHLKGTAPSCGPNWVRAGYTMHERVKMAY